MWRTTKRKYICAFAVSIETIFFSCSLVENIFFLVQPSITIKKAFSVVAYEAFSCNVADDNCHYALQK